MKAVGRRETTSRVYLVYYILKEHRECQGCIFQLVQTAMHQSFILEIKTKKKTKQPMKVSFIPATCIFSVRNLSHQVQDEGKLWGTARFQR